MDDTITLRTSDDPPVELKAPRAVLIAGSKVFADLLALPQKPSADSSMDVAEIETELKPFLRLLGISHDEGHPLDELEAKDWPVVARLADKYDAKGVKGLAEGKCWKWQAMRNDAVAAFKTAAALGCPDLTKILLLQILQYGDDEKLSAAIIGREREFDKWMTELKMHAFEVSVHPPPRLSSCSYCRLGATGAIAAWLEGMRAAVYEWQALSAASPFVPHLHKGVPLSGLCATHQDAFLEQGKRFEEKYRDTAPDFPF